jgi:predicted nucleic acid-binding protein
VILVDSSVWIDYFRGTPTAAAAKLDALLGTVPLAIGDLIATEVLQGCRTDREFALIRKAFDAFELVMLGGEDVAFQAAANFRLLRARGATVRKTIDTIIATRCIVSGFELLHSDRDFDPFEVHLGLRCVRCEI